MAESLQSVSSLWLSGCSFPGVDGWRSGFARFPPQGTRWHTQRWNTGFDLCTLEVVGRTGLHRSDQSGRIVECWWSSMGHLACINGQTTKGKRLQYMHTCMRGYKCNTALFFFFGHLNEAALTYEQGDLNTEYASTGTSLWECDCGTWMGLLYWHQGCPTCRPFILCSPKDRMLFVRV